MSFRFLDTNCSVDLDYEAERPPVRIRWEVYGIERIDTGEKYHGEKKYLRREITLGYVTARTRTLAERSACLHYGEGVHVRSVATMTVAAGEDIEKDRTIGGYQRCRPRYLTTRLNTTPPRDRR